MRSAPQAMQASRRRSALQSVDVGIAERQPLDGLRTSPLQPRLVAEVSLDHIENGRFRHGSRLIQWGDDKPAACTVDQIAGG